MATPSIASSGWRPTHCWGRTGHISAHPVEPRARIRHLNNHIHELSLRAEQTLIYWQNSGARLGANGRSFQAILGASQTSRGGDG